MVSNPPAPGAARITEGPITLKERLRSAAGDPTETWPPASADVPAIDWSELRFGPIAFGDPLECAAGLGRPDRFRWTQPGYCELLYARSGFQIDFDRGRFAYLAWFIGPDPANPQHDAMNFGTPTLDEDFALTRDTHIEQVRARLGPATSEDVDDHETVLFYTGGGIVLEFEFDADGRLKRWNLYPDN